MDKKQSLEELEALLVKAKAEKAKNAEADKLKADKARNAAVAKNKQREKENFLKEQIEKGYKKEAFKIIEVILEKRQLGVSDPEVDLWNKFFAALEKAKKSVKS